MRCFISLLALIPGQHCLNYHSLITHFNVVYHGSSILIHFHNFHYYFPLYIFPVELWDYFVKFQNNGSFIDIALLLLSHTIVSNCLWPHGLQHARHPCPSWSPEACSNSCPPRQWCHPIISSSVVPFSSCLQPSKGPASGPFLISQLFASGGQSIGASASASVFPIIFGIDFL